MCIFVYVSVFNIHVIDSLFYNMKTKNAIFDKHNSNNSYFLN